VVAAEDRTRTQTGMAYGGGRRQDEGKVEDKNTGTQTACSGQDRDKRSEWLEDKMLLFENREKQVVA